MFPSTGTRAFADASVERTRKAYQKSRGGCRRCKARKVKVGKPCYWSTYSRLLTLSLLQCDEVRPLCGNCSRLYPNIVNCHFDPVIVPKKNSNSSQARSSQRWAQHQSSLQSNIAFLPSEISDSGPTQILQLRLMHHYTQWTCNQSSDIQRGQLYGMWEFHMPQMAFESGLVLNALLAISALHLRALLPNDQALTYAARHYFDKAISEHRRLLNRVDAGNAESLLAAAILLTYHTWLASHQPNFNGPYQLPLQVYYMAQGILALSNHITPWLQQSNGSFWWNESASQERNNPCKTMMPWMHPSNDDVLYKQKSTEIGNNIPRHKQFLESGRQDLSLLSKSINNEVITPEKKVAYKLVVGELENIYVLLSTSVYEGWSPNITMLHRRIINMPIRTPSAFLRALAQQKPIAMALLARSIALLKLIDAKSAWWIHGSREWSVAENAVQGIRGIMPAEWTWTMAWPLKVVTGEICLDT